MTAFLLMFPLAATSTRGAIRRLGRRWQVLHRLVYISAAAAALHFIWKVKVVAGEPIYYGVALILLLTFRMLRKARRSQPSVANPLRHNVLAATGSLTGGLPPAASIASSPPAPARLADFG